MTRSRHTASTWLLLVCLAAVLNACAAEAPDRLWLKAPGWSRAQLIGYTQTSDPVPVALDDTGTVYFFLIRGENELAYPRVLALDRQAEPLWDYTYDMELARIAQPQILWDGGGLHLFWLADQGLYHAQVDKQGNLVDRPSLLLGASPIDSYDAAVGPGGAITLWFSGSRRNPGLYALPPGKAGEQATLVDPEGVRPDLQVDDSGTLHAIWAHYPPGYGDNRLYYGAYPGGQFEPGKEALIHQLQLGMTTFLVGPRLGLDQGQVYYFWTELTRTGMQAGQAASLYIHFPPGRPDLASPPRQLFVPAGYNLTYQPYAGGELQAGDRVPMEPWGASYITDIAVVPSQEGESAITFRARIEYLRRKDQPQVATLFLERGDPTTYQLLSFTPGDSLDPAVYSDQEGFLYLTWLERGELPGFMVYFTSTAPDLQEALNTLSWRDLGKLAAETLFGLLTGALLVPVVFIWLIVPVALMALTSFLRSEEEDLTDPGTLVSLVLAGVTYWVGKLLVLPGMRSYVPFSAWVPFLPAWSSIPLQIGVPLITTVLALLAAWHFTYRQDRSSALYFMLIYAVVDGVLTTAVYGVLVFAAF